MSQPSNPLENKSSQQLLVKYHALPAFHQRILQIRALIYHTRRKTDFVNYLIKSGLKMEDGNKPYQSSLKPIFKYLTQNKFLNSSYNFNSKLLHHLSVLALSDSNPYTEDNLEIIRKVIDLKSKLDLTWGISWQNHQIVYLAIYTNDPTLFLDNRTRDLKHCASLIKIIADFFYIDGADLEWIKTRHPIVQIYLCCAKLFIFYGNITSLPKDTKQWNLFYHSPYFTEVVNNAASIIPLYIHRKFSQINLCMGFLKQTQKKCESFAETSFYQQETLGTLAFFQGDISRALRFYGIAIKLFGSFIDKREWSRESLHVFFYILALMQQGNMGKANTTIANLKNLDDHAAIAYVLEALVYLKQNNLSFAKNSLFTARSYVERNKNIAPLLLAFLAWVDCLLEPQNVKNNTHEYKNRFFQYLEISHYLAAHLYAELVMVENATDPECSLFLNQNTPFGAFRFLNLLKVKQPWEYAIDQLHLIVADKDSLSQKSAFSSSSLPERRLVWLIHPDNLDIEALEQKQLKSGMWSDGRAVALKRFYKADTSLDYLTEHDKEAVKGLRRETYGWYNEENFNWDKRQTLKALIGHPLVFHLQNRGVNLELVKGELELQAEKVANGYHLSLAHYSEAPRVFLERETTNRYRVIDFSDDFVAIGKIVSKKGLTVPADAKDKVIEIIRNAKSGIRISSDIEDDSIPAVPGDTTCCVHLFPISDGMKLNLWIKPFGDYGHYYRAAHGQMNVIATITSENTENGEKIRQKVMRDFSQEKESVKSLINGCPTLAELDEKNDEWYFESIETCLEVLLELEEYKKSHPLNIEWPKGQTLKLKQTVSFKNLSLSIKGNRDWFEYEGEIKLDQGLALDMKNLLNLFENNNYGRFVKLADGEFIALTEKFKKQLEELKAISEDNKIYRLSTGVLRTLAEDVEQMDGDQSWQDHIKKLQSMEKHSPAIPSTLQATLREYQEAGFKYLSRLAHWEIGACLADDMGVGKTVQTIALLLELAPLGPVLVVAPTSVCFIWREELTKFAPTLNAHTLSEASDRQVLVNSLGKMDVLICSYSLLHQSGEMLLDKDWQAVVLDEAQAIKNHDTKRAKCAIQLKSNCRIALTGTPIENHLGELWSIFRFLNPGLLGSLQSFQERYAAPIEKYNDAIAKRALKNLVHPYILRRTKTEVLQELPPKTEQSILIEPTAEEMAFYEAVRVKALERIQRLESVTTENSSNNANTKRFSILAEIARLRQACCHSTLADPNINLESSKIKTFLNITKNLIENNHKALVFSQYVRYLDKIKQTLDAEKITYQYLDGSTPVKARQVAVAAFQAGAGDLFLISLKAGGAGLNLTAADYVIILDPWWNPAVEEQASDRAHRIGQERPVTVYRLIMKNSIEEKIIKLHKDKKDLADDLLSGSDISGKITEEELMRLIDV